MTGAALLVLEGQVCGSLVPSRAQLSEFSAGVSFVPVEVLESYLDDVLDLGVSDESLFIRKPRPAARAMVLLLICFTTLGVVAIGGPDNLSGISLSALLLIVFLAGLGSALYFVPRTKVIRRFNFANAISREVSSRRGHDRTDMGNFATRLLIRDFWQGKQPANVYPASVNREFGANRELRVNRDPARLRFYH